MVDESAVLPRGVLFRNQRPIRRIRFQACLSNENRNLLESAAFENWSTDGFAKHVWKLKKFEEGSQLISPSGFIYSLAYGDEANIPPHEQ